MSEPFEIKPPARGVERYTYKSELLEEIKPKRAEDLTKDEVIELAKSHNVRVVDQSYKPMNKVPILDTSDPASVGAVKICGELGISQHGIRWWRLHKFSHGILNDLHAIGQKDAMDALLDRLGGLVDVSEPMTPYKQGALDAMTAVNNLAESILKTAQGPYEYPYGGPYK